MQYPHFQNVIRAFDREGRVHKLAPSDATSQTAGNAQDWSIQRRSPLADHHVLLVEDQVLISLDIYLALRECGARVTDVLNLQDAIHAAKSAEPSVAILDVDLDGEDVFPAADILYDAGVPILFHSSVPDQSSLLKDYPGARLCPKPTGVDTLLLTLVDLIEDKGSKRPDQRNNGRRQQTN